MKKVIPIGGRSDGLASIGAGHRHSVIDPAGWASAISEAGAEQQLLLLHRLLGCVDSEELLRRFFGWAKDLELAAGLDFAAGVNEDEPLAQLGSRHHHSARYRLRLEQRELGAVALYRRERFSESELLVIEQALGALSRCLLCAQEFETLTAFVTQDPLTGVGNRKSLDEWMSREISRCRRHRSPLSMMMIDVDHFKMFNDALGHLGGDRILIAVTEVLKRSTRGSDLLFRFGGDEFTVLLPHTDLAGAREAAQQIRDNLSRVSRETFGLENAGLSTRPDVSIGVAAYHPGDDEDSFLQRADTHLYHAKSLGRGQICDAV
jgi:diguanylate cyclase (GGDEF)-like protein